MISFDFLDEDEKNYGEGDLIGSLFVRNVINSI